MPTYYVAKTGSDGYNGLSATYDGVNGPWLTIGKASISATTGDTVNVGEGIYSETFSGTYGFNFTENITWVASASVTLSSTSPNVCIIRTGSGISFTGPWTWDGGDNKRLIYYQMASGTATFTGCTFVVNHLAGFATPGITIVGSGDITFSDCAFSAANLRTNFLSIGTAGQSGNITITSPTVTVGTVYDGGNTFVVIAGTWVVNINGSGLYSYADTSNSTWITCAIYIQDQASPSVTGQTITDSSTNASAGFTHIRLKSTGTAMGTPEIHRNKLTTNREESYLVMMGGEGSDTGDEKMTVRFTRNSLYGPAYLNPARLSSATWWIHLVLYGYQKDGYFAYNEFYGGGMGLVIKGVSTWTSGGVFSNVFYNSRWNVHIKGPEGISLYNNTFVIDHDYGIQSYGISMISWEGNDPVNITVKNNVFLADATYTNHILIRQDGDVTTGFASDYNCLYKTATTSNYGSISGVAKTKDEWIALGYDANSVFSDPSLVSIDTKKFYLNSSSPCIDAGASLGGAYEIGVDRLSVWPDSVLLFSQASNWDMGAFPYRSSTLADETGSSQTSTSRWTALPPDA